MFAFAKEIHKLLRILQSVQCVSEARQCCEKDFYTGTAFFLNLCYHVDFFDALYFLPIL